MDILSKELGIPKKHIFPTNSSNIHIVVVHSCWLKKWLKNIEIDNTLTNVDFPIQPGESVPYPWQKVFITVLSKKVSKVLPLPRYKLTDSTSEYPFTFAQLLQYVSHNNHRNLWKESYKKYCQSLDGKTDSAIVNLTEHDQLLTEIILRLYGCNIIRVKKDSSGKLIEYKEISNKYISKLYEAHVNLLSSLFTLETDNNFFIVHRGHFENSLLDCLNFSPNLFDMNYTHAMFVIYQLLNVTKALNDRGLSLGPLTLENIYLSENLWLQIIPTITNNIHVLDTSLISEHTKMKQAVNSPSKRLDEEKRNVAVQLETLCMLWVRGRISNLDYLLHLNRLAGRSANDPQAHYIVPWVTDFASGCGKNWRDLTKSKYRLTKGDRQLDMTYEVTNAPGQIPHHVSDILSDITCYVYLARRTPKEVLCKHVRNKWVPAEYPASIQRMQEWTPDECIPEFYTDPTVFKSIHEDLPDLGVPSWATCVEDFITKHREALESTYVSENLHHWIDLTFGYKLYGTAAVKHKNVCLSLVDGHVGVSRGACVPLLAAPHPTRATRVPPRHVSYSATAYTTSTTSTTSTPARHKKTNRPNDTSEEITDEDDESSSLPQHVSRLAVPSNRIRPRHKSTARARSLSKTHDLTSSSERASSHTRHSKPSETDQGKTIIYLPKDFNPIANIQAIESLDNFTSKCFYSKAQNVDKTKDVTVNTYKVLADKSEKVQEDEGNAFTNQMFLASYEQNYLKKFTQDAHLDAKNRSFNSRYTTDVGVYKQFVTENRRQDMLAIGCLIVEICLHKQMRPLRCNFNSFKDRYNTCRTVLKYNFESLPKCVRYIATLVLDVQPPSLSFQNELSIKENKDDFRLITVTDKGLPPPTPSQLLQPLLLQHLIPFPKTFKILHNLLSTLHEYDITSQELNILYNYECDGHQCDNYQSVDKTKMGFSQRIAEGKIQACATHLELILSQINCYEQFDVIGIFLTHYIELLQKRDTSILAAWYLFDAVSKSLGPEKSRKFLLKHILNLYEDDDLAMDKVADFEVNTSACKQKFIKLYHNIFLLQLMVRFGMQCFLDNFTQHLVEAVGGYKDVTPELLSPGHICRNKTLFCKKPRYSDANMKTAMSNTNNDIFSPDTSCGSEIVNTPSEKLSETADLIKDKDGDNRSENELFHFESEKEGLPSRSSRSKSPAESIESYTLSAQNETMESPSPSEALSPQIPKEFTTNPHHFSSEKDTKASKDELNESVDSKRSNLSPTVETQKSSMFTSYLHFADDDQKSSDDVDIRRESHKRAVKSLNFDKPLSVGVEATEISNDCCRISDMSCESLIWLAHRIGPVLTCRYITRNLLKMLTLCYIGKENLASCEGSSEQDEFDTISITNCRVVGDNNAAKVIKCLTAIVGMYGEQLIVFQYLAHMSELIACCRRRLSAPLEGGLVACLQLFKYLLPYMSDKKVMEQLQDTIVKCIIHPCMRLVCSGRGVFPCGARGRGVATRKLADTLYALLLRLGPGLSRAPIHRFFLIFDKATGKVENWPKQESETGSETKWSTSGEDAVSSATTGTSTAEGFLELCRDGSTAEWAVRDGLVVRQDVSPDPPCSPPRDTRPPLNLQAQEELLTVFNAELAYQCYHGFASVLGREQLHAALHNVDTVLSLCAQHSGRHAVSPPLNISSPERLNQSPSSDDHSRSFTNKPEQVYSNSFGSNVTLVGNRIDVASDTGESERSGSMANGFDVVAHRSDNGFASNRHLRGDWLIYWEHEIGRPDKETRFNLKQIKLQTFVGHTQAVKSIHCLDNESSFMSASKDKSVRLWSLRNQGDGNATSQCNWSYTGHKKGVLSLTFLESLRLAVSTDSVVHIWDPFMETVVNQLDNIKSPISIVRTLPGPSTVVVAATTDATIKIIDARCCNYTHDLKVPGATTSFIRSLCVSGWLVVTGLASGQTATIDLRTSQPLSQCHHHHHEVLRLVSVDSKRILSSSLDQTMALWNVDNGEMIAHLKGPTEPVHCLSVYHNQLISGTTNNRIGVHTDLHQDASFSSTKLRSDTLKGVLTSMAVLPLNRLLLLGSDNGSISLIC